MIGVMISKIDTTLFLSSYYYPEFFYLATVFLGLIIGYKFGLKKVGTFFFLLWGATHSAPGINHNISRVYVLKTGLGSGYNNMIVMDMEGSYDERSLNGSQNGFKVKVYEVGGRYKTNRYGSVRCFQNGSAIIAKTHCIFIQDKRYENTHLSRIDRVQYLFKDKFKSTLRSNGLNSNYIGFIFGIFFGDQQGIYQSLKQKFKTLGIYHLLVISGLHFTLIASCIRKGLFFGIKILYIFKLLNPLIWIRLSLIINILVCFGVVVFMRFASISGAGGRAGIIFLTHVLLPYITGRLVLRKRVELCFLIQILVFPLGIISLGTFISWVSYLSFVSLKQDHTASIPQYTIWGTLTDPYHLSSIKSLVYKIKKLIIVQTKLLCFSSCVFSTINPISLFINLVLVPCFPLVMIASFCLCVFDERFSFITYTCIKILGSWFYVIDQMIVFDNQMLHWGLLRFLTTPWYKIVVLTLGMYFLVDIAVKVFYTNKRIKL